MRAMRLRHIADKDALFTKNLEQSLERERILVKETQRAMEEELEVKRLQLEEVQKMKEIRRRERVVDGFREWVEMIAEHAMMVRVA